MTATLHSLESRAIKEKSLFDPPHSIEAEQSVVGGVLMGGDFNSIAGLLEPSDFYRRDHQRIFEAISDLHGQDRPADIITVSDLLDKRKQLDAAGGFAYIATLAKNTPSAANIVSYAGIVREASLKRQALKVATEAGKILLSNTEATASQVISDLQGKLEELQQRAAQTTAATSAKQALNALVEKIDAAYLKSEKPIYTGIQSLDDMICKSFEKTDLTVLAGSPGGGKSSLALQIARCTAQAGIESHFFSLEMGITQNTARLASQHARRNLTSDYANFSDEHWTGLTSAISRLSESPIVQYESMYSLPEIAAQMNSVKKTAGLIVIDYCQIINVPGFRSDQRAAQIGKITATLKRYALKFGVPVILLSQLNRDYMKLKRRPILADLSDSSSLEKDADRVIFIHRPDPDQPRAELIMPKNRNGAPAETAVATRLDCFTFEDFNQV